MTIYPVIMCGGSGTRLWPASREDRPKQFVPLIGDQSTFRATVERVAEIRGEHPVVVVAGVRHRAAIEHELQTLGVTSVLILEPAARDSCAAMAAAAAWIAREDPEGVAIFLSADHYIPDIAAFSTAAMTAAAEARRGRIVTFGVKPDYPATGFGYIRPHAADGPVKPLAAFVEKPDEATARDYIAKGYLWNSGMFVTSARHLLAEISTFAPEVAAHVKSALREGVADGARVSLGPSFLQAPKISIDYAVMEKTASASVLPVDFKWEDVGAWDAVWKVLPKDKDGNVGPGVFVDSADNLVHAPRGVHVDLIGAQNLAVVLDGDALLICDLSKSQAVKTVGERMKAAPVVRRAPFATLKEARTWFDNWMQRSCLPLWWSLGADHDRGGFREVLDLGGASDPPRRGRVQPRQIFSFATAGALGWRGPWRDAANHGLAWFDQACVRPDGLCRALVASDGRVLDDEARLYDQAFVMLAFASLGLEDRALQVLDRLEGFRHPAGGWREVGGQPFQSNPHMHLLEAALAWMERSDEPRWARMAGEIIGLAQSRFIDHDHGFIREFFNHEWSPVAGDAGHIVEPGHQFEWAWLLSRYQKLVGDLGLESVGRKLFANGLRGLDTRRQVIVDELSDDLSVNKDSARLWPQTEYLKAALAYGETEHALRAAFSVFAYLDRLTPGSWADRLDSYGHLDDEPSPASTLYHLIGAWQQLRA